MTQISTAVPPDTGTTVYAQEQARNRLEGKEASEVQYLIKWVNWSHLHNTWETGESRPAGKDEWGMVDFTLLPLRGNLAVPER